MCNIFHEKKTVITRDQNKLFYEIEGFFFFTGFAPFPLLHYHVHPEQLFYLIAPGASPMCFVSVSLQFSPFFPWLPSSLCILVETYIFSSVLLFSFSSSALVIFLFFFDNHQPSFVICLRPFGDWHSLLIPALLTQPYNGLFIGAKPLMVFKNKKLNTTQESFPYFFHNYH